MLPDSTLPEQPLEAPTRSVEEAASLDESISPISPVGRGIAEDVSAPNPRRTWLPYLILAVGLALTALGTTIAHATVEARDKEEFREDVEGARDAIRDRLDTYLTLLRAGAGLVAVKPGISREEFQRYVTVLSIEDHVGLGGLGFSRRVTPAERELFEREAERGGRPLRIWPEPQGVAFPIALLAPESSGAALGFDMGSEPVYRAAMEQARDTGAPAASGPVRLLGEEERSALLIYAPVYDRGVVPAFVEARRASLVGFVYAVLFTEDLFRGIRGERESIDIEVHDGAEPVAERLLYSSRVGAERDFSYQPRFTGAAALSIAGRPLRLSIVTRPEFERRAGRGLVPFIIGGGLMVSALLFLMLLGQSRARAEVARRAARAAVSERALRESEIRQRRLYRAETEARHSAEVASRARDEFLATLSHELRTPLTAVIGWVRMLRGGAIEAASMARGLEVIERNVTLEAQLIEDLLDVSRIITGKLDLEVKPITIDPVVLAAVATLRTAAEARSIQLEVDFASKELMIMGDQGRIQQVLWNLLSNAIRFTPREGRVDVRVQERGLSVEIEVSDTGKGISAEFLPHVFDRFRQADSSATRSHGGLGLGLSIVRHLVELHGGTVSAASPGEGRGAVFTVLLPICADAPSSPQE